MLLLELYFPTWVEYRRSERNLSAWSPKLVNDRVAQ